MSLGPFVRFQVVYNFSIGHTSWSLGVMDGEIKYYCSRSGEYLTQGELSTRLMNSGQYIPKMGKDYKRTIYKLRNEQRSNRTGKSS